MRHAVTTCLSRIQVSKSFRFETMGVQRDPERLSGQLPDSFQVNTPVWSGLDDMQQANQEMVTHLAAVDAGYQDHSIM